MQKLPRVSIITICYNSIKCIEKTINSVLGQDYPNIEYILIDGASTDGTKEIIEKYASRLSYFISEPDKGIYDAMNKGIKAATGDWIHFRNAGDYFVSTGVLSKMFEDAIQEDVIVLHGDEYHIKEWGYKHVVAPITYTTHKKAMPVFHPATFVRTSYHKAHLFDTSYRSAADYDFFYRCSEEGVRFMHKGILVATYPLDGFSSTNLKIVFFENQRVRGKDTNMYYCICSQIRYMAMRLKHSLLGWLLTFEILNKIDIALCKRDGWHEFRDNPELKNIAL